MRSVSRAASYLLPRVYTNALCHSIQTTLSRPAEVQETSACDLGSLLSPLLPLSVNQVSDYACNGKGARAASYTTTNGYDVGATQRLIRWRGILRGPCSSNGCCMIRRVIRIVTGRCAEGYKCCRLRCRDRTLGGCRCDGGSRSSHKRRCVSMLGRARHVATEIRCVNRIGDVGEIQSATISVC